MHRCHMAAKIVVCVDFIKIPFINKGIEFINLHSIFEDNLVISSIPNYFNNSQTPIICYNITDLLGLLYLTLIKLLMI